MPDDLELMRRILRRDQSALGELYDAYGNAVFSLALRILRDSQRAEEIAQDVFLRVWNAPEKWDSTRGRLISWLLTVTRYAAIDLLRAEQRQPDVSETPLEEDSPIPDPSGWNPAEWQDGQELRKLVNWLPPEQTQVIQLAFYGGLSHREMADKLGIPFGTVKTRLRLGLQKLRQMWVDKQD
jgi:RNA polymerase sigma-70 factor, ECF subfamily